MHQFFRFLICVCWVKCTRNGGRGLKGVLDNCLLFSWCHTHILRFCTTIMYEGPLFLCKSLYYAYLDILCAQNTKCMLVSIIFKKQNIHVLINVIIIIKISRRILNVASYQYIVVMSHLLCSTWQELCDNDGVVLRVERFYEVDYLGNHNMMIMLTWALK